MGILDELRRIEYGNQTNSVTKNNEKKEETREEKLKKEEEERRERIQQILNDEDPTLDEPYPLIAERQYSLISGGHREVVHGYGYMAETWEYRGGYQTGTETKIQFLGVVTKRIMMIAEVSPIRNLIPSVYDKREKTIAQEGEGEAIKLIGERYLEKR